MNAMKLAGSHRAKLAAKSTVRSSPILVGGNGLCGAGAAVAKGFAVYDGAPDEGSEQVCAAMASSCGDSEGCAEHLACPSQLSAGGCSELLNEISNLMTGVLLNAQALEWKLPPYSHLKRPVRGLARSAQRTSELMKTLLRHCTQAGEMPYSCGCSNTTSPAAVQAASAIGPHGMPGLPTDLTSECDTRTSEVFPKRDDSDGR